MAQTPNTMVIEKSLLDFAIRESLVKSSEGSFRSDKHGNLI